MTCTVMMLAFFSLSNLRLYNAADTLACGSRETRSVSMSLYAS